ncbi:MAG: hypothetical protein ABI325_01270 [Ginsengibacter sp.]
MNTDVTITSGSQCGGEEYLPGGLFHENYQGFSIVKKGVSPYLKVRKAGNLGCS